MFLSAVPLFVFDYNPFWLVGFMWGCLIVGTLFPVHRSPWDFTETETRLAHKATAWTFYVAVIIAWASIVPVARNKEISFSLDIIMAPLLYVPLLFTGVRFILLAYLLRRERLPQAVEHSPDEWTYRPLSNPYPKDLPEGEWKKR